MLGEISCPDLVVFFRVRKKDRTGRGALSANKIRYSSSTVLNYRMRRRRHLLLRLL